MDEQTLRKLRSKLDKALAANETEEAIRLLTKLSAADNSNARWPHKQGDLLRKLDRYRDAASAYAAAADLYAAQGFLSRAVAVAKAVANLDPRRLDVLERIDPDAAKQFRRNLRPPTQPFRQGPARADPRASGVGPARGPQGGATETAAAGARPSRAGGMAPEREASPEAFRQRVTMQGFAGGPVARAPAAGAAKAGAAQPNLTAKPGAMQGPGPTRQPADKAARAAAEIQARTLTGGVSPLTPSAAGRPAQPAPTVPQQPFSTAPQRLTMPGRKHPMVLDDDEPYPEPAPRIPVKQQLAASRSMAPSQQHASRSLAPSQQHASRSTAPAPQQASRPVSPSQGEASRVPSAPAPVAGEPAEDDEIIIVVEDDELEPAAEVAPRPAVAPPQPSHATTGSRTDPGAAARAMHPPAGRPLSPGAYTSVKAKEANRVESPFAGRAVDSAAGTQASNRTGSASASRGPEPSEEARASSHAAAAETSVSRTEAARAAGGPQPSAAKRAKPKVALDRLSVPPPRPAPSGATTSTAAPAEPKRTSPSPIPERPARAFELAPPAELTEAEAVELPTGKVAPLPAHHPARRPPESMSQATGTVAPLPAGHPARRPPESISQATGKLAPQPAGHPGRRPPESLSQTTDVAARRAGAAAGVSPSQPKASTAEREEALSPAEGFSRALEAAAAPSIIPPPSAAGAVGRSDVHAALLTLPLFAKLDLQALNELAAESTLVEFSDETPLVQRGKPSDALYGVLNGSATLFGPERRYEQKLLVGDLFGEACVLKNEPSQIDVCATGELHALKIPRATLTRLLKRKPRVADQLLGLLTSRLRFALLAASPVFQELDSDSRQELGARFEVLRASKGRVVAKQGELIDGLYLSLTGRLTVEKPGFVSMEAPAFSMFGHQLLLSSRRSPATITARSNLLLLQLPASAFSDVALRYPRFAARLARLVTSDVVPLV
jgi:CRP-like cAMP-binding protein